MREREFQDAKSRRPGTTVAYVHRVHSLDDPTPPPSPTETAVIVPVPAAERAVGPHRARLDRAAGWGVPAHVTVLYPFLRPDALSDDAFDHLAAAIASEPAFDATFTAPGWFGSDVLWVGPDPAEPFRRLTRAVWRAFPGQPPYGGAFDDIHPHLTVAERSWGAPGDLERAEEAVRPQLPFAQRVDHALLIAGTDAPRSWRTMRRLPLGP
jgi:2'-5' RNA ligase